MVKRIVLFFTLLLCVLIAGAQNITGTVVDATTGEPIPMAAVIYRSHSVAVAADNDGKFSIQRHNGWALFISALGYHAQQVNVTAKTASNLNIKLKPDTRTLNEVTIRSKRAKYSRKDNPAVELMKRVIAAKKQTKLENNDYYQFYKYQKLTLAKNNVTAEELADMREKGKKDWLVNQVELNPMSGKMVLPVQVSETVSRKVFRKDPRSEKTTILGQSSNGVANLVETAGTILDATIKDVFTDVDIYDDQIRLLQYMFTSPIGKDAISFYRFYIADTVMIDNDKCIELSFVPNNQQDFGFRGELFVLADSSLHVRRVELTLPKKSDVNFVENMRIEQEYVKLPDGQWVLDTDNMFVEMRINKMLNNALVSRTTKLSDYSFEDIPKSAFRGSATLVTDADSKLRGKDFWNKFRTVELTKSESSMNSFVENISNIKGMKYILFGVRAFMDNYVGLTANDSIKAKFDLGPINTIVNKNSVDGFRFRLSGRSNAALNKHLFWQGYIARGMDSHKWYYSTLFTYAFNKKNNEPWEFPIREVSVLSEYDIMSPSDKFLLTNKDNLFTAFHVKKIDKLYFYNRQRFRFKYETLAGFSTTAHIKTEGIKGADQMHFQKVISRTPAANDNTYIYELQDYTGEVRTTELSLGLRFAPGETFINTKQRRYPINYDAPVFSITHTMGINNFLGGKYNMNLTEATLYKRFWLNSWGKLDVYMAVGAQWNKVPFPLLFMPPTNLSWLSQPGSYTFQLMNNMEFLNDRYAMWHISWDLNGKILNRIPLIKKLKWREYVSFRGMFGHTTDKNNPFHASHYDADGKFGDDTIFYFPVGCNVMDPNTPYMEALVGIHNIFKFLEIDYVHRFTYKNIPSAMKSGLRFAINMTF